MKLYGYWRSSCSWRVRAALALKGIEYEYVAVHLLEAGGRQHADEYRDKNPMRQVPTLEVEVDGEPRFLTQSLAICEYLDDVHPSPRLVPEDAFAAAKVRQLAETINAGIQPLQNLRVLQRLKALGVDAKQWSREWIENGFTALERDLASSAGRYSVGDEVTLADVCLAPQVYNASRFELSLDPYPTLSRVAAALDEHEAFVRSHPDRQPDAQPN